MARTMLTLLCACSLTLAANAAYMVPVDGAPAGYQTYDLVVNVTGDWNASELVVRLTEGSFVYDTSGFTNPPAKPSDAILGFMPALNYITWMQTPTDTAISVAGNAAVLDPTGSLGGPAAILTADTISIAWFSTATFAPGEYRLARITMTDDAIGGAWSSHWWDGTRQATIWHFGHIHDPDDPGQPNSFTLTGTEHRTIDTEYHIGWLHDSSSVHIQEGGSVGELNVSEGSTASISGGSVFLLRATGSSGVSISGGSVDTLSASDTSTVIFDAYNFLLGEGLTLDGDVLVGTGLLSGAWFGSDETWSTTIIANSDTATIQLIPEPATLSLLGVGVLGLLRRRR